MLAILVGTAVRTAWTPGPRWFLGIDFSAKTLLEVAVLLLGAVGLSACSGDTDAGADPAPTTPEAALADVAPRAGNIGKNIYSHSQ